VFVSAAVALVLVIVLVDVVIVVRVFFFVVRVLVVVAGGRELKPGRNTTESKRIHIFLEWIHLDRNRISLCPDHPTWSAHDPPHPPYR
ncbi:MAG: hypothetical protein LBR27_03855, partial [Bifidobacteriaceae bacterium]|nr:hypothetical protein [Bifidobacteriaceae bacterium]